MLFDTHTHIYIKSLKKPSCQALVTDMALLNILQSTLRKDTSLYDPKVTSSGTEILS